MVRSTILFSLLCVLFATTAIACPGQTGKVIFEDNFADDSGGWKLAPPWAEIKDGALLLRPDPKGADEAGDPVVELDNITFSAGEADYCVEFIFPKSFAPDNNVVLSILFLNDLKSVFKLSGSADKTVFLSRWTSTQKVWDRIFTQDNAPTKVGPGDVNSLRVVAKGGKLALFLNGQQLKAIRAQTPEGDLRFGLRAEVERHSQANPVFQVKSFKVTTGQ